MAVRAPRRECCNYQQRGNDNHGRQQRPDLRRERQDRAKCQRQQCNPGRRRGNAAPDRGATGAMQRQLTAGFDQRKLRPRGRRQIVDDIADSSGTGGAATGGPSGA